VAALGGAQLALFQHEFVAYMSGGRGFLALAAVILGRWRPLRAVGWAVGIGALQALEATLSSRAGVPHALLQAMPFALTLLAVAGPWGRARAPAALG
jgi:simple sugar transport system permease protein